MTTIHDVARSAGVSSATVSYVLNNGPRPVTAETRRNVLSAMRRLGYQPNAAAQRLARRRADCVGVLIASLSQSSFQDQYFLDYLRGIGAALEDTNQHLLLLFNHTRSPAELCRQVRAERSVDGLILIGSGVPDSTVRGLAKAGFPAVLLGRRVPGLSFSYVVQDYRAGALEVTRHLLERGYRRIGFLGQSLHFSYAVERLAGYRQALAEAGVPYVDALVAVPERPGGEPQPELIDRLVREAHADSLITDRESFVLAHLRMRGVRVPAELALAGLDEDASGGVLESGLTTVRIPKFEMGRSAVAALLERTRAPADGVQDIVHPVQLVIRQSTPSATTAGAAGAS
jgi:DNA-binding LacI/PurR family transcriptional regulator